MWARGLEPHQDVSDQAAGHEVGAWRWGAGTHLCCWRFLWSPAWAHSCTVAGGVSGWGHPQGSAGKEVEMCWHPPVTPIWQCPCGLIGDISQTPMSRTPRAGMALGCWSSPLLPQLRPQWRSHEPPPVPGNATPTARGELSRTQQALIALNCPEQPHRVLTFWTCCLRPEALFQLRPGPSVLGWALM